jgi:aminopeptidase N
MFVLVQTRKKFPMSKNLLFVLFAVISYLSGQGQTTHSFAPKLEEIGNIANFEKARFHHHPMQLRDLTEGSDYNVTHYRCEWQVDPAINYVSGKVTTRFVALVEGLDSVQFDLHSDLSVDSIIYHGQNISYSHINDVITISLNPIAINTLDSISVIYQGVPPSTGFGSFVQSDHSGTPIVWTLSEPYGASEWWPCKNGLTDKADSVDIIVRVPNGNRAASNGLLIEEITSGNETTFHWKHRFPIATYLICMAVTNYVQFTDIVEFENTEVPVLNYIFPEDSAASVPYLEGIIPVMQLYDTLFGIYPFSAEKYGHAQFGWGGGMEHQTMTFVVNFGHELLAHELAHHWFGDKMTCGSWEDIWLNEGFATYLSGITYEHMFDGQYWMPFKSQRISNITSQPGGSVLCDDTTSINRIFSGRLTYNKGAMILHQLRWVVGDEVFYQALNNYLNDPLLAYRFVRTSDLIAHFEAVYGQDLSWYFDDWYSGKGFPSYEFDWGQNGQTFNVTVHQSQSTNDVDFFELPLPLYLSNGVQDTLLRLDHSFDGQTFTVDLPFTVTEAFFDPELWIISAGNIVTNIDDIQLEDLSIYPNPASNQFQIKFATGKVASHLILEDSAGRIVFEENNNSFSTKSIDVSSFAPGIYYLTASNNDSEIRRKIVVE